jgi:cytochrome P450
MHAGTLTRNLVRAFLMDMIIGFAPTNTLAGGFILDTLLDHPGFLAAAREAAVRGDDDLLTRCLFETLRFKPINFGPFRVCKQDAVLAQGTRRAARIPAGTRLLVSTWSAMFDCSQIAHPFDFRPDREASDLLHFGWGMHWCVGAFIARAQLARTFRPLLLKRNLRRAPGPDGRLQTRGTFPDHLFVEYEP